MFRLIPNVLTPAEIEEVRAIAARVRFVDGRVSNPHNTQKKNLQVEGNEPDAQRASRIATTAMSRCPEFADIVFPKNMATPMLCRYDPGMTYGAHVDASTLALPQGRLRTDVSATLFLSDPAAYEGGELCIHLGTERMKIKGEPGSMIVYPSTTLHEVMPVIRGQRLVFICFIESNLRDAMQREMLYTLNEVYALEGNKMEWENRMNLQYVITNLYRAWVEK